MGLLGTMAEPLSTPTPSWSDIPLELAGLVLHLLPAYADRARFAAVCPQWRAAAQQLAVPPPLPLLALPDGTFYSLPCTKTFRFPGCGFAGYKSACGGWLVFPSEDSCILVNPFSRGTVTLPALSMVRLHPPNADIKHMPADTCSWLHIKDRNLCLRKLMLCSSNLVAAFVKHETKGQILVCQPGALSWSVRAYDECIEFEDMTFYRGKLYVLSNHENLFVVNISQDQTTGDPQVSRIGRVIEGDCDPVYMLWTEDTRADRKLYLVECGGQLLMVRRTIFSRLMMYDEMEDDAFFVERNEFEVFEADFKHCRWISVTTLGDDQVLFLGQRCSQAVPVCQYGIPGNRIFFLDDEEVEVSFRNYFYLDENASFGVYDMMSKEVSSPQPMVSWNRERIYLATWLLPRD